MSSSDPTPAQLRAIHHVDGPCVIIAGAGTGKTTTMCDKIAHLLSEKIAKPEEIVALTFSNEAASDIRKKLSEVPGSSRVKVSTFHSFCLSLIEEHSALAGLPFSIRTFNEEDVALFLFENDFSVNDAKRFANTILKAKDNNISRADYARYVQGLHEKVMQLIPDESSWVAYRDEADFSLKTFHLLSPEEQKEKKGSKKQWQEFIEAYGVYMQYSSFVKSWELYDTLRPKDALDFADMQLKALELLNKHGTKLLPAISHVIVDEFQDTSRVQFELVKLMSERTPNITIVGDGNQSIYAFRGAFTDNVDEFLKHFRIPKDALIPLDTSFRSTQHILDASHELILNNYPDERKDDCIKLKSSTNKDGEKVLILDCENELEEARAVAERITILLDSKANPADIAVLFRSYRQSELLQDELVRRKIQFRITGSEDLFHKPYIKTILSYLYTLSHLQKPLAKGSESLWRLFHYNDSLSHEDSYAIGSYLKKNRDLGIADVIFRTTPDSLVLSRQGTEVINRVKKRLSSLRNETDNLPNLILSILEKTGISRQFSHSRSPENTEAMMHLRDFHELAVNFSESHGDNLGMFIEYIELLYTVQTTPHARKYDESGEVLRLMSMHAAKGLQFETVFLLGFYDKRFPLTHGGTEPLIPPELDPQLQHLYADGMTPSDAEISEEKRERKLREERRLCYVAMTRAKRNLVLSCARNRNDNYAEVSVFLKEIGYNESWRDELIEAEASHIVYYPDTQELACPLAPQGRLESFKSHHRQLLLEAMDSGAPKEAVRELLHYLGLSGASLDDLAALSSLVPIEDVKSELAKAKQDAVVLSFDPKTVSFSQSGLKTYDECPKKFELNHVLHMPVRAEDDISAPTSVGSFIHEVLETALKANASSLEDVNKALDDLASRPENDGVDMDRSRRIIDVFWARNKDKMGLPHRLEELVKFEYEGLNFNGKLDRIDELPDGTVEIIDYKTGKYEPDKKEREWQLSLYAYGAEKHLGLKPRFLTLELLELDKPRRFELQDDGTATAARVGSFNINERMKELVELARKALNDYQKGFKPTEDDNACRRCEFKLYCPKWG